MAGGLKGVSRTPGADVRARRNAAKLSADFLSVLGDGIETDADGLLTLVVQTPVVCDGSGIGLDFGTGLRNDGGVLKTDDTTIDHDSLLNVVSDEHIDHSIVSVTAGTGLTGGGDITASRTITLADATAAVIGGVKKSTARADSGQSTVTLSAVTDPVDAPVDADTLRDDLVANTIPDLKTRDGELETALETLAGEFNDLLAKLRAAGIVTV